MSDALSVANANAAGSTITASALYVQLHIGDPGTAGTANQSSVTTRQAVTWAAPLAGTVSATNTPQWTNWAGTNGESVTDVSFWSQATGGTFEFSCQLTAGGVATPATMLTGESLTLNPLTVALPTAS